MGLPAKRLERTFRSDAMVGGVCGGIGKYTKLDSNLIRLAAIVGTLFTGIVPGVVAYFAAWMVMPEEWDN